MHSLPQEEDRHPPSLCKNLGFPGNYSSPLGSLWPASFKLTPTSTNQVRDLEEQSSVTSMKVETSADERSSLSSMSSNPSCFRWRRCDSETDNDLSRVALPVSGKGGTGMTFWAGGHSSEPHCPHGHPCLPCATPTQEPLANAWIPSQPPSLCTCCSTCLARPSWEYPAGKLFTPPRSGSISSGQPYPNTVPH